MQQFSLSSLCILSFQMGHSSILILVAALSTASGVVCGQSITDQTFRGALEQTVRKLDNCHIVVANRGDQTKLNSTSTPGKATFLDIWLCGDQAQFRLIPSTDLNDPWWDGDTFKPSSAPLTSDNLDSLPGLKACVRPRGDYCWAESRQISKNLNAPYPSLYSCSKSILPTQVFYVPLVDLNRAWSSPSRRGIWFALNHVIQQPLKFWKVISSERLNGVDAIIVEVDKKPTVKLELDRYEKPLSITPVWKVWFSASPDDGYFPLRIENSMRYEFRGSEFRLETSPSSPSSLVFEAQEITKFDEGLWFPRKGKEETYSFDPATAVAFNPDRIVDEFLDKGRYYVDKKKVITTRREWYVFDLQTIDPASELWFDPPKGVCVHDVDSDTHFIAGVSEEESRKILELDLPNGMQPVDLASPKNSPWHWLFIGVNVVIVAVLAIRVINRRRNV